MRAGWAVWAENTEKRLDRMIAVLERINFTLERIDHRLAERDAKEEERRRLEWLDNE